MNLHHVTALRFGDTRQDYEARDSLLYALALGMWQLCDPTQKKARGIGEQIAGHGREVLDPAAEPPRQAAGFEVMRAGRALDLLLCLLPMLRLADPRGVG